MRAMPLPAAPAHAPAAPPAPPPPPRRPTRLAARAGSSAAPAVAHPPSCCAGRRAALRAAAALLLAQPLPQRARAAEPATSSSADFFQRWPYAQPADIIPFIKAHAKPGDVAAILAAYEEFGSHYPMYALGARKGALLEALVRDAAPSRAVEIGTFLGYSALRTARALPPVARLLCLEASPANAAVAAALLDYAGVGDRVDILVGAAAATLPDAAARVGPGGADFVFMDHCKECYLPDARSAEALGLLRAGSVLAADNVVYPGAPDFLAYVATSAGRYETRLLEAPFEYDQPWRQGWEAGRPDAISVSVKRAEAAVQQ